MREITLNQDNTDYPMIKVCLKFGTYIYLIQILITRYSNTNTEWVCYNIDFFLSNHMYDKAIYFHTYIFSVAFKCVFITGVINANVDQRKVRTNQEYGTARAHVSLFVY